MARHPYPRHRQRVGPHPQCTPLYTARPLNWKSKVRLDLKVHCCLQEGQTPRIYTQAPTKLVHTWTPSPWTSPPWPLPWTLNLGLMGTGLQRSPTCTGSERLSPGTGLQRPLPGNGLHRPLSYNDHYCPLPDSWPPSTSHPVQCQPTP